MTQSGLLLLEGHPGAPAVSSANEISDDTIELTLELSPDLPCLDGHFPGRPVVPGVALLDWAIVSARSHWNFPGRGLDMQNLKFYQPVAPPTGLRLRIERLDGGGKLRFEYRLGEQRVASGQVDFT